MRNNIFYIVALVVFALFCMVQFGGPAYFQFMFQQGQIDLLNQFTVAGSPQSLDFYLGRGEELLWGPWAQALSGMLLIVLVLGPLKEVRSRLFFWAVFAFLVVTKFEVLFYPPYGDSVGGPFAEGWWLAQHNFDFAGLAEQPGYAVGGPKVYLVSLFPAYLALMYKIFPSMTWFLIVNHLVFFAMAAGVVMFVRSIAQRIFSFEVAGLLAVLVLSWPVFQSQTEAINMELPSLFFAVWCAFFLVERRVHWAGVMALLAVAFKGSGIFACGAFFCYGLFELSREKDEGRRAQWMCWAGGLAALGLLSVVVKFWIGDQHVSGGLIGLFKGWPSLKTFKITYFYLASVIIGGGLFVLQSWLKEKNIQWGRFEDESFRINLIMSLFAAMWFLLFLNFVNVSPRYRLAEYPFLLFTLFWTAAVLVPRRMFQVIGLVVLIIAVQFNAYGLRNAFINADYVVLEENLQYRADMKLYQKLAKTIEGKYNGMAVVAPFIFAQTLAVPEFGYVEKTRDVTVYGFNCTYGVIHNYEGIEKLNIARTVYIAHLINQGSKELPYPIHPNDKVLEVVEWGNRKAWIFMGGFSIDMMRKVQQYMMMQQEAKRKQRGL